MTYKDRCEVLEDENQELKNLLKAKEQVISILYNLIKDMIFWNKK